MESVLDISEKRKLAAREVCLRLDGVADAIQLEKAKLEASSKFGLQQVIKNADVFQALGEEGKEKHRLLLKTKRARSLSGVSVVAIMLKPVSCPYHCAYCPTSDIAAKSYTGFEPAALRARRNGFDSFKQVSSRLKQFAAIGHEPQKCELIIMGGTFNSEPLDYQESFVKGAYDAFNGFASKTLEQAIEANEKAPHRIIGLTFETRPDWASQEQVLRLLNYGATRIELGVQSLDDGALIRVKRGHGARESVEATRNVKNAFAKVGYHVMPGLYSTPEKDVGMFERLFSSEDLRPDMLKIYPTLVVPGTVLFELWKKGEFEPYREEQAAWVIARGKQFVPRYCRIMRVDRDIPSFKIADGVKKLNLRELVKKEMDENGLKCECIRCREAGLASRFRQIDFDDVELHRFDYEASGGKEVFLSFDTAEDYLVAFLRLRAVEAAEGAQCGVRELRVYGEQVAIGSANEKALQHKSFGKKLLGEAERIAREEFSVKELRVTSGVGVREYYRKQGYALRKPWMVKKL
ncbi:MAG: tRNA uridine(34) 5-carboxymethylaminomethyl modification radical SAM/GNAT enzyme Elp3 [Candidatus Norongarragalinales archaeon]